MTGVTYDISLKKKAKKKKKKNPILTGGASEGGGAKPLTGGAFAPHAPPGAATGVEDSHLCCIYLHDVAKYQNMSKFGYKVKTRLAIPVDNVSVILYNAM